MESARHESQTSAQLQKLGPFVGKSASVWSTRPKQSDYRLSFVEPYPKSGAQHDQGPERLTSVTGGPRDSGWPVATRLYRQPVSPEESLSGDRDCNQTSRAPSPVQRGAGSTAWETVRYTHERADRSADFTHDGTTAARWHVRERRRKRPAPSGHTEIAYERQRENARSNTKSTRVGGAR